MKYTVYGNTWQGNAQEIGEWLSRLPDRKTESILDAARDKSSPMHKYIEWNDFKAAEQFRLQQVRTIVAHIGIQTPSGPVRAFENVVIDDVREYVSIGKIADSPELIDQVVQRALSELSYWRLKHQRLEDFFGPLFDEITKAEETYRSNADEKGKEGKRVRGKGGRNKASDTADKKASRNNNDSRRVSSTR